MVTGVGPGSSGLRRWPHYPSSPNKNLYIMFLRWTLGHCIGQLLIYRNCHFPPVWNLGWFPNSLQHHSLVTGKPVIQQPLAFTYFFHSRQFIFAVLGNVAKSPLDGGTHCKSLIPKLILQQGTSSGQPSHSANTTRIFFFLKCVLYPAGFLIQKLIIKFTAYLKNPRTPEPGIAHIIFTTWMEKSAWIFI